MALLTLENINDGGPGAIPAALPSSDVNSTTQISGPPWHPMTRIAFRFAVLYLGLFCLWFAQITFAFAGVLMRWLPDGAVMWQMLLTDPVSSWVGRHVFGVDATLHRDSGSGDQAAVWVSLACLLTVAVVGTAVWSVLDRRRTGYPRLAAWFSVFLRVCLGGQMLFYGVVKLIPSQMPAPPLAALLQPFGELSPMSVLWLQVGSSHPYEMVLGSVEVIAGLLLFVPRTATLGALLSLLAMAQVFLLNMSFDVPVKILSFHLLSISAVLLAPYLRRLLDVVVLERHCDPVLTPPLFAGRRANRIATATQVALGAWILGGCVIGAWEDWREYGGGRTKPELYGMWTVTEFTADGHPVPALISDEKRWRRVVFDEPGMLTYQQMDGTLRSAPAQVDPAAGTIALTRPLPLPDGMSAPVPDSAPFADFAYYRDTPDTLRLTGNLDGLPVSLHLSRVDPNEFTLRNRGFHWVQEFPYMR